MSDTLISKRDTLISKSTTVIQIINQHALYRAAEDLLIEQGLDEEEVHKILLDRGGINHHNCLSRLMKLQIPGCVIHQYGNYLAEPDPDEIEELEALYRVD